MQNEKQHLASGTVLFSAGDSSDCAYLIHEGTVGIFKSNSWQFDKPLRILGEDCIVGEMGLLENKPRSATAVTLEACSISVLQKDHFSHLAKTEKAFFTSLLTSLVSRLRHTLKIVKKKEIIDRPLDSK